MRARRLLLVLLLATAAQADRQSFRQGLQNTWKLASADRWEKARAGLLRLLQEHARARYVYAERPHVLELARLCILRAAAGTTPVETLIEGKLLSYSRSTRRLRIEYDRMTMRDWERVRGNYLHPAGFTGSHRVRVEGRRYSANGVQIAVCLAEESGYRVVVGIGDGFRRLAPDIMNLRDKSSIHEFVKGGADPLEEGEPFRIDIRVTPTAIAVSVNGKPYMRCKKDKDHWGKVAVLSPGGFEKLVLDGRTEGAWIHGLLDRAVQKRMHELEKDYDPRDHLPAWLFENGQPPDLPVAERRPWPVKPDDTESHSFWNRTQQLLRLRKFEECIAECGRTGRPLQTYVAAVAYEGAEQYEEALGRCRILRIAFPDFFDAHVQEARLLGRLRRHDEAFAITDELLRRFPGDGELIAEVARIYLHSGVRDARPIVDQALLRGVYSPGLARIQRVLHKGAHGPPWPVRFTKKSQHYVVVTDTSRGRAWRVAEALEEVHSAFRRLLEKPPRTRRRFNVYLFRGHAGYARYLTDLYGTPHAGSAGVYDPMLKQLILWDRTPLEDLLKTARHEALHQILDSVVGRTPIWFDEGLAGYFEYGRRERGQWIPGEQSLNYVEILRPFNLPEFLRKPRTAFMADAGRNYAHAWAWVHFLRKRPMGRRLFRRFWDAFQKTASPNRAIDDALAGEDLDVVQQAFTAFVLELRRPERKAK